MNTAIVIIISVAYMVLLFYVAWFAEKRESKGRSIVNNPYIYALSLAVYCTAWTFYGSVGRAATTGAGFLPVYLGPTILAPLFVLLLRKIILISKSLRITSIADFISSRYGKSTALGVFATIIAVFSNIPYISIQLKAVATSFEILTQQNPLAGTMSGEVPLLYDSSLYIAFVLAVFAILFGTRHLDPNERHEGLVAAIAFESILKLVAFLAVGFFVTYGIFDGFGDIFSKGKQVPEIAAILSMEQTAADPWDWFWITLLSMFAVLMLPRQFHIAVVENTNPNFTAQASWVFPFYLLIINIFVLPIAIGGLLEFSGSNVDPDTFVLDLPLVYGKKMLALLVAIGGFSAATGMVIVSTIALSIMISNNLVLPMLLRSRTITDPYVKDLSRRLLGIRRVSIIVVLFLAYGFFKSVGSSYALVSIGLISFAGVAQLVPAILGALYWKRGTKAGAMAGLITGFFIWFFCLPLPTMIDAGMLPQSINEEGLFGWSLLKPYAFLGLNGMTPLAHGAFWSLLLNTFAYVFVSLKTTPGTLEIAQADLFVDIYKYRQQTGEYGVRRREARMHDILTLMNRFLGTERAGVLLKNYEQNTGINPSGQAIAKADLVNYVETHLTGALGAASAKVIINSVVKEDPISLEEMFKILEQTQEAIRYSRAIEEKSVQLEQTTRQLKQANEQLKELDSLKENFITTVTHELRTPLTSIKALAKILQENTNLPPAQQSEFLGIIVSESERITRLINEVLDLSKITSKEDRWIFEKLDFAGIITSACHGLRPLMAEKNIQFLLQLPKNEIFVNGSRDRLTQVVINLVSNAIKFCPPEHGRIEVHLQEDTGQAVLRVSDNGIGISAKDQSFIFQKFVQLSDSRLGKPQGSGLGLSISKEIIERHEGRIEVNSELGQGAVFIVKLPAIPARL